MEIFEVSFCSLWSISVITDTITMIKVNTINHRSKLFEFTQKSHRLTSNKVWGVKV